MERKTRNGSVISVPEENVPLVGAQLRKQDLLRALRKELFPRSRRFYEKDALIMDPLRGGMIAALLVGPCAIDYTVINNNSMEPGIREPTADELVQRHRITSTGSMPSMSPKRPPLSLLKRGTSVIRPTDTHATIASVLTRDFVISMHQNMKSSLLYGKNNVVLLTDTAEDHLKGYLSLHQEASGSLFLKWTPNQLMHSSSQPAATAQTTPRRDSTQWLWKYAINLDIRRVIYLHMHQYNDSSPVSIVFVDADGIQQAPLQFPPGHHCVAFLSCLENGLSPFYRLDPPLWTEKGKGKILPRLKRRTSGVGAGGSFDAGSGSPSSSVPESDPEESRDYVFRIVPVGIPTNGAYEHIVKEALKNGQSDASSTSVEPSEHCQSLPISPNVKREGDLDNLVKESLVSACASMKQQIFSRAFYGWLSYSRHMKTIRNHLSNVVAADPIWDDEVAGPVTESFWMKCRTLMTTELREEFLARVYVHGIDSGIRKDVWPYLLELLSWDEEIDTKLALYKERYDRDVDEWHSVEEVVIQRDQEAFKAARLRQSTNTEELNFPPRREQSICSEVFDDVEPEASPDKENDIVEVFGLNLHRIEKDVERCDRNTEFFSQRENLTLLKRLMCTYVWRHMSDGYVQGMCDIAAPLLVTFNDEVLALACFEVVMRRMRENFPQGHGIEDNLNNLRCLVQVMDPELYEQLMSSADVSHLYFAYRWFLLDFKRELNYDAVFKLWEVIWAAEKTVSTRFQLFFALALIEKYRQILIENGMDFTDVIKFFNEMAEKHDVDELLVDARSKLQALQKIIVDMK
ncbi:Protein TBC-8 a [Aphelenchoides avenae]|nr:Protein TBC-8 a [Aphelenchus avenae]